MKLPIRVKLNRFLHKIIICWVLKAFLWNKNLIKEVVSSTVSVEDRPKHRNFRKAKQNKMEAKHIQKLFLREL